MPASSTGIPILPFHQFLGKKKKDYTHVGLILIANLKAMMTMSLQIK